MVVALDGPAHIDITSSVVHNIIDVKERNHVTVEIDAPSASASKVCPQIRPALYFSLGLTLHDIPDPSICSYCEHPMQKEFVEFESEAGNSFVIATSTPGYGCTNCSMKTVSPEIQIALVQKAEMRLREAGDLDGAAFMREEAELYRSAPGPLATTLSP
jgi:hypothetical protein